MTTPYDDGKAYTRPSAPTIEPDIVLDDPEALPPAMAPVSAPAAAQSLAPAAMMTYSDDDGDDEPPLAYAAAVEPVRTSVATGNAATIRPPALNPRLSGTNQATAASIPTKYTTNSHAPSSTSSPLKTSVHQPHDYHTQVEVLPCVMVAAPMLVSPSAISKPEPVIVQATPTVEVVKPTMIVAAQDPATSNQAQTPPSGAALALPPGGRWVEIKHVGPATWTICTAVSVFTCIFMLLPCGVWAFLCPCDSQTAYLANGTLYDRQGNVLGNAGRFRLR
eukprot:CAMPEP_0198113972 /NCGR_PEP_ID=MMETSP1442-20131203/5499_1 /TAXON_ID= /ORGANISM="Craspedostauros australis, Strain CCMP3328" /LENGTH=276 /DNA_ID=CAMNT_0043771183 /DNA_START=103 /DNA_END=933 /DNA_ORIENTATION=-